MTQINSYCGRTGVGQMQNETELVIDEYVSKANLVSLNIFSLSYTSTFARDSDGFPTRRFERH